MSITKMKITTTKVGKYAKRKAFENWYPFKLKANFKSINQLTTINGMPIIGTKTASFALKAAFKFKSPIIIRKAVFPQIP